MTVAYVPTPARTWVNGYDACNSDMLMFRGGKEGHLFEKKPGTGRAATTTQPPWGQPNAFDVQQLARPHVYDDSTTYEIRDQLLKLAKHEKRIAKLRALLLEQGLLAPEQAPPSAALRRDVREHLCSKYDAYTQLKKELYSQRAAAASPHTSTSPRPAVDAAASRAVQFSDPTATPATQAPAAIAPDAHHHHHHHNQQQLDERLEQQWRELEQKQLQLQHPHPHPPPSKRPCSARAARQHQPQPPPQRPSSARPAKSFFHPYSHFPPGQPLITKEPYAPASAPPERRIGRPATAGPTRRADGSWAPAEGKSYVCTMYDGREPDPKISQHVIGADKQPFVLSYYTRTLRQPFGMQQNSRSADGRETSYTLEYCQMPVESREPPRSGLNPSSLDGAYHPSWHNSRAAIKPGSSDSDKPDPLSVHREHRH